MFSKEKYVSNNLIGEYLDYLEYAPASENEKLPLIIYIHGAGSRGTDLSQMADVGPIKELKNGRDINAVIVAPQCHRETWFDLFETLAEFINQYRRKDNIDSNRVYIMGVSMGAYAVWQLCISHPEWFAAAVPICGGGMYWNAARLKGLPIWAFHGALDNVVYPEESLKMVSAINKNGGNAKLTVFPHEDHNSWDRAFSLDEMWEWLFEQKRTDINEF